MTDPRGTCHGPVASQTGKYDSTGTEQPTGRATKDRFVRAEPRGQPA